MIQLEPLTLEAYQLKAAETAVYPQVGTGATMALSYCIHGLTGEAGEVADKFKKVLRDKEGVLTLEDTQELVKELGDVLWYLANLAGELGVGLEDVAAGNLNKLFSRKDRGVLHGSGDNR
jgi:NTP pyrophosphatase (non-canonical NTP hydrolase)